MEKLIGWLVVGIFYAIFSYVGKQNKQKELQKKKDEAQENNFPTTTTPSQTPSESTKPISDIFGELMKQFEQKTPPVQKVKPQVQTVAQKKVTPKKKDAQDRKDFVRERVTSNESAQQIIDNEAISMPVYVYENIADTEISSEVSVETVANPLMSKFNMRDAVVAQMILQRPEY